MNDILFRKLEDLVTSALGIRIADRDTAVVRDAVEHRMRMLAIDDPAEYLMLLERLDGSAGGEWSNFAALITNRESYFFRDRGQMDLLRTRILPELIERARRRDGRLRIWSAGCSTGEEPYSVAMLLNDLHPRRNDPVIDILGTDISPAALERARQGLYGSWSFRLVDPVVRDRYFTSVGTEWKIDPAIHSMVHFRAGNLTREVIAGEPHVEAFDLILCRNVFIYLDPSAIRSAVGIFARSLNPGGYLLTAHSELSGFDIQGLQSRRFDESLIFQLPEMEGSDAASGLHIPVAFREGRQPPATQSQMLRSVEKKEKTQATAARTRAAHPPARSASASMNSGEVEAFMAEARELIEAGRNEEVITRGLALADAGTGGAPVLHFVANAYANCGEYEKGNELGRKALALDRTYLPSYYLLAQIAESRNDKAEARRLLNNVLYLSPTSVAAYVFLADGEANPVRREHLRRLALELLERLPADAPVEGYPGADAGELLRLLQSQLGPGPA